MTQETFSELCRAYRQRLVKLAFGRLQDHHLSEDIAQETLLRAFRALPSSMAQTPWPWLSRVAINASEDLRAVRREALPGLPKEVVAPERVESATERNEAIAAVGRAIESLTPIQEQTIRLSHFEEKSYAEIASIQGLSVETVRDRLHYSRQILKAKLRQFADHPLSALFPALKFRGVYKFKVARGLVKVATLAAVSVTGAGTLGPSHTVLSQVGADKVRTSLPADVVARPGGAATSIANASWGAPRAIGTVAASANSSRHDLTRPIEVPSGPSEEGPGSMGGTIGPVTLHCDEGKMGPVMETLCMVARR